MQPEKLTDQDFLKKGRMKKSPLLMDTDELERWRKEEECLIKVHLFSIGQPLVYRRNGAMIAEFADGTIKQL